MNTYEYKVSGGRYLFHKRRNNQILHALSANLQHTKERHQRNRSCQGFSDTRYIPKDVQKAFERHTKRVCMRSITSPQPSSPPTPLFVLLRRCPIWHHLTHPELDRPPFRPHVYHGKESLSLSLRLSCPLTLA